MLNYLYYNYAVGIFMFIIDRLFLHEVKTDDQYKKLEQDIKTSLNELETNVNELLDSDSKITTKPFYDRMLGLRLNNWTRQLVVFIMFQLPIINAYLFYSSIKEKLARSANS